MTKLEQLISRFYDQFQFYQIGVGLQRWTFLYIYQRELCMVKTLPNPNSDNNLTLKTFLDCQLWFYV